MNNIELKDNGDFIEISGKIFKNKDEFKLAIQSFNTSVELLEDDKEKFLSSSRYHTFEEYLHKVKDLVESIKNKCLREFTLSILNEQLEEFLEIKERSDERYYFVAKLLKRIVEFTNIAKNMIKDMDGIDLDSVICSALLRDIGDLYLAPFEQKQSKYDRMTCLGKLDRVQDISHKIICYEQEKKYYDIEKSVYGKLPLILYAIISETLEKKKYSRSIWYSLEAAVISMAYRIYTILDKVSEGCENLTPHGYSKIVYKCKSKKRFSIFIILHIYQMNCDRMRNTMTIFLK